MSRVSDSESVGLVELSSFHASVSVSGSNRSRVELLTRDRIVSVCNDESLQLIKDP